MPRNSLLEAGPKSVTAVTAAGLEHSSIIWPVWPNGCVFIYKLSGSGFESGCGHLNFRFRACFQQGVP